jgi:hypothetical protein
VCTPGGENCSSERRVGRIVLPEEEGVKENRKSPDSRSGLFAQRLLVVCAWVRRVCREGDFHWKAVSLAIGERSAKIVGADGHWRPYPQWRQVTVLNSLTTIYPRRVHDGPQVEPQYGWVLPEERERDVESSGSCTVSVIGELKTEA